VLEARSALGLRGSREYSQPAAAFRGVLHWNCAGWAQGALGSVKVLGAVSFDCGNTSLWDGQEADPKPDGMAPNAKRLEWHMLGRKDQVAFETIIFEKRDGVARITFNRPEALNAFSPTMSDEFKRAVEDISGDRTVRVVVISGAGDRAFMSGADIDKTILRWVRLAKEGGDVKADVKSFFTPSMLEDLPQPVIAAVKGYVLGGGCEIALACDLRIATENAKFGQPEIKLGVMPGLGGSIRLPRLVGKAKAMQMILTGDPIDAHEAHRIGLVNEVVPADKLDEAVDAMVDKLKGMAPMALASCKAAVNAALEKGVRAGLETETDLFADICATDDAQEGATAFLQKRKPEFKGQ
jgi:enoyl-CoA hydratase